MISRCADLLCCFPAILRRASGRLRARESSDYRSRLAQRVCFPPRKPALYQPATWAESLIKQSESHDRRFLPCLRCKQFLLVSMRWSGVVPASYVINLSATLLSRGEPILGMRALAITPSRCSDPVRCRRRTEVCLNLYTVETVPQRSQSVDRCHLSHRRGKVREFHHQARAKR